jgi:hypothetical protein
VIGTFNTCSRGPTHQSLIDTGRGYNHLRAPPGLRLSKPTFPIGLKEDETLNFASGSLHSTSTAIYHLSIALLVSCVTCPCFSVPPIHLNTIISFIGLATCKDSNISNTYHSRPSIKNALQGPPRSKHYRHHPDNSKRSFPTRRPFTKLTTLIS